ncbi:MAG: hypothetical protein ACXADY_14670 [Candidatus Hodarchaeales archaeon]|jgi:hypothetical protein
MNEKTNQDFLSIIIEYRQIIAFAVSVIGVFIIDLTIASSLPYWLPSLVLGIVGGIIIGSSRAGLFTGLGTLVGRFASILIMILTMPGLLSTLDLFLAAIGDVLGAPLPPGSLIVILLSVVICGLFGLFGGLASGSATKLTKTIMDSREVRT